MPTLTEYAIDIRNFLLNKNLITDTVLDNGLTGSLTSTPEIGKPAITENSFGETVQPSKNIVDSGYFYLFNDNINFNKYQGSGAPPTSYDNLPTDYKNSVLAKPADKQRQKNEAKNMYITNEEEVIDLSSTEAVSFSNQTKEYLTKTNELNLGGPSTNALDVIGSILSGGIGSGFDISANGVSPNFDIRTTLAGRVLGSVGAIKDTPLGQIGAQQLTYALINNSMYNFSQSTIGHINLNPLSLLQGNDIIIPTYKITTPTSGLLKALDYLARVGGFQVPISELESASWEYASLDSEFARNNHLIGNTGKGQTNVLFSNLKSNKYTPPYNRGKDGLAGEIYVSANTCFDTPYLGDINTLDGNTTDEPLNYIVWPNASERIGPPNANEISKNPFNNKNGILNKTFKLFNNGKVKTLTSALYSKINNICSDEDEIQTGIGLRPNGNMSKGSAVQGSDGSFCRTWSPYKQYDKVSDLQKHSGLWKGNSGTNRKRTTSSVLEDNGFVRISPNVEDDKGFITNNIKRFMFSIENLAWADFFDDLPPQEQGPGDLVTDIRGRIMWFPPYDISFTENSSVSWESTQFIGRPEPVYTYNHVERAGTLQFKVIVDHPSVLNELRYTSEKGLIEAIASGCEDIPETISTYLTPNEKAALEVMLNRPNQSKASGYFAPEPTVTVYFPNDVNNLNDSSSTYETISGDSNESFTSSYGSETYIDKNDNELNKNWNEFATSSHVAEIIKKNPCGGFKIVGYASKHGTTAHNQILSQDRADYIATTLLALIPSDDKFSAKRIKFADGKGETGPEIMSGTTINDTDIKKARKCDVVFEYFSELNSTLDPDLIDSDYKKEIQEGTLNKIGSRFVNESEYFYKLSQENRVVYNDIRQKLRWFHPAFHSTTPEGLNSRLTFLLQCTRAGSTAGNKNINAVSTPDNLVFGRPPICILRIGDFYHTKIIMDSVNFSYEPLVWDLNPEGIGVQPMIATVDISFKFIGGSSLGGPINRLQNALSFNFFANNEVYSDRPDYIDYSKNTVVQGYRAGVKNPITNDIYDTNKSLDESARLNIPDKPITDQVAESTADTSATECPTEDIGTTAKIEITVNLEFSIGDDEATIVVKISPTTEALLPGGYVQVGIEDFGTGYQLAGFPYNIVIPPTENIVNDSTFYNDLSLFALGTEYIFKLSYTDENETSEMPPFKKIVKFTDSQKTLSITCNLNKTQ